VAGIAAEVVTVVAEDTAVEATEAAAGRLRIIPIPDSRPGFFFTSPVP